MYLPAVKLNTGDNLESLTISLYLKKPENFVR
jgi:hypothetical protein